MKLISGSLILLLLSSWLLVIHQGTAIRIAPSPSESSGPAAVYQEKTASTHRHIILSGGDYHRGVEFGRLMRPQIFLQEDQLVKKLDDFVPQGFVRSLFFTGIMAWFHDAMDYLDRSSVLEMQGIAQSAPKEFDHLADGFTRQIAYHGLHEVGQMFVDEDRVDMGCFAVILKGHQGEFVVGRNFDFDVDGLFDREKVLKWSFPSEGLASLSVIWAGMVGAVTGVNEAGVFVAINSAGSEDFVRVGTPTTIVLKEILTRARNLDEALAILRRRQVFITEIFTLAHAPTNRVVVVEKSPKRLAVKWIESSSVVANHLTSPVWGEDKTNHNRRFNLTSDSRHRRGEELLQERWSDPLAHTVRMLRDDQLPEQKAGHLAHRGAIDSLIASQSVIFDLKQKTFYVNLGPGTQGKYLGYDLEQSFQLRTPTVKSELPAGKLSEKSYEKWQHWLSLTALGFKDLARRDCRSLGTKIEELSVADFKHYLKERLFGDFFHVCANDQARAKTHWQAALALNPAFMKVRSYLEEKVK